MWRALRPIGTGLFVLSMAGVLLFGCAREEKSPEEAAAPGLSAEQRQQIQLLVQSADDLYNKSMQGDLESGRQLLIQLGNLVTAIRFEGMTTIEGVAALTDAIVDAKESFASASGNVHEAQLAAAAIRLAADALLNSHRPMWMGHYKLLVEDVELLDRSSLDENKDELVRAAHQLQQHFKVVRSSLLISRDVSEVEKMDSLLTFVSNQVSQVKEPYPHIQNVIPHLRQTLDILFMKKDSAAYMPMVEPRRPILWTLTFASIIIAALSFAGWRLAQKSEIIGFRKP